MIAVVDYGLGNVQAFLNMFKLLGVEATRAKIPSDLTGASKIILPGVGAFDHAINLLNSSGMRDTLDSLILKEKIPVLGICVGMQILASTSDEGKLPGLGWVPGKVCAFLSNEKSANLSVPHMGWNDIQPIKNHPLFVGLEVDARFYFLHSYYFECQDFQHEAATSLYGSNFSCAISADNVYGVQFHPEKSHHFGIRLLKNFVEL
ncbi:imidazole glycerol phosphate synthase subunit HisH [Gammaproteobacteria bacterium]|nr:imidazole glycerol phosphate synthase subunit HisH [Gammaproteobacteria bacterium]